MEDQKLYVIPTRFRAKISHELSFPLGAEKISMALTGTIQLEKLVLHFNSDYLHMVKRGRYAVLSVGYSSRYAALAQQAIDQGREPLWGEWQINVSPVPRLLRHKIQIFLLDTALPKVKDWLEDRSDLKRRGEELMTFFYDEIKEEFPVEYENQPEPLRS